MSSIERLRVDLRDMLAGLETVLRLGADCIEAGVGRKDEEAVKAIWQEDI